MSSTTEPTITDFTHIAQDNAGALFAVRDDAKAPAHCWMGIEVKRVKGTFAPKAKARVALVSKQHAAFVQPIGVAS